MIFKKDKNRDNPKVRVRLLSQHQRHWWEPEALLIETKSTNYWAFRTRDIYNNWPNEA